MYQARSLRFLCRVLLTKVLQQPRRRAKRAPFQTIKRIRQIYEPATRSEIQDAKCSRDRQAPTAGYLAGFSLVEQDEARAH